MCIRWHNEGAAKFIKSTPNAVWMLHLLNIQVTGVCDVQSNCSSINLMSFGRNECPKMSSHLKIEWTIIKKNELFSWDIHMFHSDAEFYAFRLDDLHKFITILEIIERVSPIALDCIGIWWYALLRSPLAIKLHRDMWFPFKQIF